MHSGLGRIVGLLVRHLDSVINQPNCAPFPEAYLPSEVTVQPLGPRVRSEAVCRPSVPQNRECRLRCAREQKGTPLECLGEDERHFLSKLFLRWVKRSSNIGQMQLLLIAFKFGVLSGG